METSKTVMVVDDEERMRSLLRTYLAREGYRVVAAADGREALRLAKTEQPDLIILDVMMPNQDGWQVLRGLKENPDTARTPVIICSVLKEPELALSLGADAYLKKPVERLELLAQVERLLNPAAPAPAAPRPESPDT